MANANLKQAYLATFVKHSLAAASVVTAYAAHLTSIKTPTQRKAYVAQDFGASWADVVSMECEGAMAKRVTACVTDFAPHADANKRVSYTIDAEAGDDVVAEAKRVLNMMQVRLSRLIKRTGVNVAGGSNKGDSEATVESIAASMIRTLNSYDLTPAQKKQVKALVAAA